MSAFLLSSGLTGNKVNYERIFYSSVLSFVVLLVSGVLLNFFGQIGSVQVVLANAAFLGLVVRRYKKIGIGKLEFDLYDVVAVFVFLTAFFIRAAPVLADPSPFGSYDVIQHYAMAMETYERGSVPDEFPKYLNWYGTSQDNVNGVWVYPPGNAIMAAVMKSVFGLSWPQTIHAFAALFDSLTVLIIYMLAARLVKSKATGLLAAMLFSVSGKNISSLYFGQTAYELGIMLSLLALFAYISETHSRNRSLVLSGLAAGLSFLVSPLAAAYFIFSAFVISLSEYVKSKKNHYVKDFATAVFIAAIVSLLFLPKFAMWFSFFSAKPPGTPDTLSLPDLVWPFKMIARQPGLPGWYFDPNVTMGALWLIMLAAGIAMLLFSKFEGRGILAAWFLADYILTHSYIVWGPLGFGILYDYAGRWMAQSSIILAVVAGLAGLYKISNAGGKILVSRGRGLSIGLVFFVLILILYVPGKLAAAGAVYSQPYRMSADMFSLTDEIRADTKEGSAMLVFSASVQAADERRGLIEALTKTRVYTQPNINGGVLNLTFTHKYTGGTVDYQTRYIMFDYGGFARTQQFANYVENYQNLENSLFGNAQPAFSNNEIRIYRLG